MLKYKDFCVEGRSNPELNIKLSTVEQLEKYSDDPNVFISFTEIHKIGINPGSKYRTPNGIYAYPLKQLWGDIKRSTYKMNVPFAGNNPNIFVFKPKYHVKDLETYSEYDYVKDCNLLQKMFKFPLYLQQFQLKFDTFVQLVDYAERTAFRQTYNSAFWNLTRIISDDNPVKWTNIFIKLGYYGFVDYGKGIIHGNEPSQAVFFNATYIKVIDHIKNTPSIDFNKVFYTWLRNVYEKRTPYVMVSGNKLVFDVDSIAMDGKRIDLYSHTSFSDPEFQKQSYDMLIDFFEGDKRDLNEFYSELKIALHKPKIYRGNKTVEDFVAYLVDLISVEYSMGESHIHLNYAIESTEDFYSIGTTQIPLLRGNKLVINDILLFIDKPRFINSYKIDEIEPLTITVRRNLFYFPDSVEECIKILERFLNEVV